MDPRSSLPLEGKQIEQVCLQFLTGLTHSPFTPLAVKGAAISTWGRCAREGGGAGGRAGVQVHGGAGGQEGEWRDVGRVVRALDRSSGTQGRWAGGARRKVGFLLGPGADAQAQGGDKEGVGLVCTALVGGLFSCLACTILPNRPAPYSPLAWPAPPFPPLLCV